MASRYTPELVELILERVSAGVLLAKVLRMPEIDVPASTFKAWRKDVDGLEEALQAAREHGFDVVASDALDIVDGLAPVPGVPSEASRDKARADIRLKLLARYDPKRYGERVQVADADGEKIEASPLVLEVMALLRPQEAVQGPREGQGLLP